MSMRARSHFRRDTGVAAGFTLIELLISIAIFSVMTGYVISNYRTARQSDELRQGASLLANSIRRVQTMALAGEGVLSCSGGSSTGVSTTCATAADCKNGGSCVRSLPKGYGVHLTMSSAVGSKQAVLFADLNGDRLYEKGEEIRTDSISAGPSVSITSLAPMTVATDLDIVLEPPKPTVWFNGSNASAVATVVLQHSASLRTRSVTVNRVTGQVSADY